MRSRNRVLFLFCIAFLLSLALSAVRVRTNPSSTFFLLPTRAWELLLGSLLALLPVGAMRAPQWLKEMICVSGIALILWPVFAYTESTVFPGLSALPPCLGAAFVIWANTGTTTRSSVLLRTRPVIFIGLISYSLYLWHWPLFAYATYWFGGHAPLSVRLTLLLAGFVFAVLSWRYVETPFRVRKVCGTRRSILTFAGGSLLALCALGFVLLTNEGFPSRLSPEARRFADGKNDRPAINDNTLTLGDAAAGKFYRFGDLKSTAPAGILVWGDSHAKSAVPAFDSLAREMNWSGLAATRTQQAPLLGFHRSSHRTREDSLQFNENVIAWLKHHPVKHVILVGYWKHYSRTATGPTAENSPICDPKIYAQMTDALLETIRQIKATGARPWVLLDVPVHPFDVPQMLARSVMFENDITPLCAKPDDSNGLGGTDMETIQKIQQAGASIIDPRPRFLDSTGTYYRVTDGEVSLYSDSNHLTTKGANRFLLPTLREAFTSIPE